MTLPGRQRRHPGVQRKAGHLANPVTEGFLRITGHQGSQDENLATGLQPNGDALSHRVAQQLAEFLTSRRLDPAKPG